MSKEKKTNDNEMFGLKRKLITGCGNTHLIAFFNTNDGTLVETFYVKGSSGGCSSSYTAISRLISLASRNHLPTDGIIDQLKSTETCPSYRIRTVTLKDTSRGTSCASAIGFALEKMIEEAKLMVSKNATEPTVEANNYRPPHLSNIELTGDPTYSEQVTDECEASRDCTNLKTVRYSEPVTPLGMFLWNWGKDRLNTSKNTTPSVEPLASDGTMSLAHCPDCGCRLAYSGGCRVCNACGWSKCD